MKDKINKRKKRRKKENEQEDRNWNPSMKNWLPKTGCTEQHQGGTSTRVYVLMPRCQNCQRGREGGEGTGRVQGSGGEEVDGEEGEEEREWDKGVAIGTFEKGRFQNWTINT